MGKKIKVLAIIAITAIIVALPLNAQSYRSNGTPFEGPVSNTNTATAGVFGNDVDDMMDVNSYSGVLGESGDEDGNSEDGKKRFGYVYGGRDTYAPLDIGYAARIGNMYLGARYAGRLVQVRKDAVNSITGTWDLGLNQLTGITETITYTNDWTDFTNQIEVLLGISGMGIKIGVYESMSIGGKLTGATNISIADTQDGVKTFTSDIVGYKDTRGWITPFAGWGMNLGGGDAMLISPYAQIGIGIFQDHRFVKRSTYTTVNGRLESEKPITTSGGRNEGYMLPMATVGSWFELPKNEDSNKTIGFGIEYGFSMNIYSNDYNDSGVSGNIKGTVQSFSGTRNVVDAVSAKTDTQTATIDYNKASGMNHSLTPSFLYINEVSENFKFGAIVEIPVYFGLAETSYGSLSLNHTTTTDKGVNGQTTVTKTRTETFGRNVNIGGVNQNISAQSITTLQASPAAGFGASYILVPGRFTINAGLNVTPVTFRNITTSYSRSKGPQQVTITETIVDGKVTYQDYTVDNSNQYGTDSQRVQTEFDWMTASVSAGFVFNFTENMFLDLRIGSPIFGGSWDVDVSNLNILFALKF